MFNSKKNTELCQLCPVCLIIHGVGVVFFWLHIYRYIRLVYHFLTCYRCFISSYGIILLFVFAVALATCFDCPLSSALIVCVCSFLLCAAGLSATCRPPEQTAPSASGSGIHALSSLGEKHKTQHTHYAQSTAQILQRHLHIPKTFVYFSWVGLFTDNGVFIVLYIILMFFPYAEQSLR